MFRQLLLPNKFKRIGWCLLIPVTILWIVLSVTKYEPDWLNVKVFAVFNSEIFKKVEYFTFTKTNITGTVLGAGFIAGAMFVGFSKEKREDEFIQKLRLSSLMWAVWVNYSLLFLAMLFVYGTVFLSVMIYNMFTVLIIFIVRFNYLLIRTSKTMSDEK